MTLLETEAILRCVETALGVYRNNEGRLSADEIRMKSLLGVVRKEIAEQLCADADVLVRKSV